MKRRSFLQSAAAVAALSATPTFAIAKTKKEKALGPLLDPWTGPHGGIPRFDQVKTTDFKPAFTKGMNMLRAEIRAITTNNAPATFDNTVVPFEDAGRPFGRVQSFFGIYTSTMNDKTMQKIEADMSPVLAAFNDEIIQNEALFGRLKAVYDARQSTGLNAEQQRLTDVYYTRFARRGAAQRHIGRHAETAFIQARIVIVGPNLDPRQLGLHGLDAGDHPAMPAQLARRIQSFGLCLHPQAEQRLGRFVERQLQLLVAHLA